MGGWGGGDTQSLKSCPNALGGSYPSWIPGPRFRLQETVLCSPALVFRALPCVSGSLPPSWGFLGLSTSPRIQLDLGWWPQEPLRAKLTWFLILGTSDMHSRNVVRTAVISYPKRSSLERVTAAKLVWMKGTGCRHFSIWGRRKEKMITQ